MIHQPPMTKATATGRMRCGIQHPVPVQIFDRRAGRFETIEAVNDAAAQELVRKINAEKGILQYAYIPVRSTSRPGIDPD
jgi:hypothetical protein